MTRQNFTLSPAALSQNITVNTELQSLLYQRYWPDLKIRLNTIVADSLMPPEDIYPDEWAEKSIVISPRVSKRPGLVRLFAYQRGPLRAIKKYERIVVIAGTQTGKTIIVQCALGYFIDQDPGPCMVVYPTQKLCMKRSKKHLKPMITESPVLAAHLPGSPDDLLAFAYTLDRMDVSLAWAGSPSDLASEPIRYLIRDEFAKFPGVTITEADSMSLTYRRTGSYSFQRRVLDVTTPTLAHLYGWIDLLDGTYHEFYVPCPECGEMQVLRWPSFRYPNREPGENENHWRRNVMENTTIFCKNDECDHYMTTLEKNFAVRKGEERPNNPDALFYSLHIPRWYSLDVKLGEIALRYIDARENPGAMRDFINSDCAEPWRDTGANTSVARVLAHTKGKDGAEYEPKFIPIKNEVLLLLFIDVQQGYFWYQIWAMTATTMYAVDHGTVADWEQINTLREQSFPNTENQQVYIRQTFIDARYRTQEVYEYCAANSFVTPLFGCSDLNRRMTQLIRWNTITKYPGTRRRLSRAVQRMDINAKEFAEQTLIWLNSGFEDESTSANDYDFTQSKFFLHRLCNEDYAIHLTRRKKTTKVDQYGREVTVWIDTHKRHDYFDLFVYALAARYFYSKELHELKETAPNNPREEKEKSSDQ